MTSIEVPPVPLNPDDIGRNNDNDGILGSNAYLSEVKVINITPHEVSEIKTSVITLEKDAFPVPRFADDPNTKPISVFSTDIQRGYVQWEPMGDLYAPTILSPLGSYKYLRVKWDCYLPAGSLSVQEPYEYYVEKIYEFRSIEPLVTPNFTLTPGVLSALGQNGSTKPTYFEFSAHGYVNKFNFHNGLYGQDRQADIPDGSGLLAAKRKVIYDAFYAEVGDINEPPHSTGGNCLAKEYTVHGRIVPELDYDGAAFQVIHEGSITDFGNESASVYGTSGRDAPPFWYNFNYELQHNKNIIPFTFLWGVSLPTYDEGTYDPRGPIIDPQDRHGRVGGTPKTSSNHGRRRRSDDWVSYFLQKNQREAASPNIFHSEDDITFSIIGPDAVCQASSVNVCAVYTESDLAGLKKTVINWFDKRNHTWYDVEVFGYNFLPSYSCWVLRGCLHVNNSYLPGAPLTNRDINSQLSNKLEKTWAIDLNFYSRKLFTPYKNTYIDPPQEFLARVGRPDFYKNVCEYVYSMWDSQLEIQVTYVPNTSTTVNSSRNPFYGRPHLEDPKTVGFIKGLHEPYAMSPIGVAYRPGIQGEQPGFNYVGIGSLLALAGMPDARFLEACTDLEWGRNTIEAERDGSLINQFADHWLTKRQVPDFPQITLESIGWNNKSIDSPEYEGIRGIIENDSVLGYIGAGPAINGSDVICKFQRGLDRYVYRYLFPNGRVSNKTDNFARYMPGGPSNATSVVDNKIGHPTAKHQHALGYVNNNLHCNDTKNAYTVAHFAFGHMLSHGMISGDKNTIDLIDHYMRVVTITHGPAEHASKIFDRTGGGAADYRAAVAANVGRQEGRPIHIIVGGFSVTTNRELAEATLYRYSRRFWNTVHVTNWEEYPNGYPNKPWRSLWLPPWAGGIDKRLTSEGLLREVNIGRVDSAFNSIYRDNYKLGGDLALRAYNMAHIRILDINPLSVSGDAGNRATWDYNVGSSSRTEYPVWRSKWEHAYERSGSFPAIGLSAIDGIPGAPNGSVLAELPHRLYWRYTGVDNDPWGADILTPRPDDPNSAVSSIPGTRVPEDLTISEVNQTISRLTIAQSYQNSLLFVFLKPFPEQFETYAQIFRERAARGQTPTFTARVADYSVIADELSDTATEMNKYFVRAARTISKCVLLKVHENSQSNLGIYGIGYDIAPYSPSRPYDQYQEEERKITLDAAGEGQFPVISQIKFYANESPSAQDLIISPAFTAGAYQVALNDPPVVGSKVTGGQYSTIMWASNCVVWAWDAIYNHGDFNDPRNLEALEELKNAIIQWYGSTKFDLEVYNRGSSTNLRNIFYPKLYGTRGFPGVGAEPPSLRGSVGDYELQPWLVGSVDGDVWKSREVNTTLKVITGVVKGSSTLSLDNEGFVVLSPNRRTYTYELQPSALYNPGKGVYPFFRQTFAKNGLPRSIEAVRDIGMSSLYVNGGETNQFDFTLLEQQLNEIATNRCQANVRIHIDLPRNLQVIEEPGQPRRYVILQPLTQDYTLPKFLRTEFGGTVQSFPYLTRVNRSTSNTPYAIGTATSGYIPDYDNPALINECVRLITELGRVYDGDHRLIEFQVGFGGHWGEWNQYDAWNSPELDQNNNPIYPVRWGKNPPAAFLSTLAYAFDAAFTKTFITGRFLDGRDNDRPLPDSPVQGLVSLNTRVGVHDDSFGWNSIDQPTKPWYTETQINHYNWGNKWVSAYMGGETRPEIARNGDAYNTTFSGTYSVQPQNLLDCIRRLKTTSLSEAIAFQYFYQNRNTQEQYDNMLTHIQTLGYSLFIQNAIIPTEVLAGQSFQVSITIKNTGVAPFYQNWPAVITLQNQNSNSLDIETNWDLSSIQPDGSVTFTHLVNGSLLNNTFTGGETLTAYLSIKKPAAFLRDVTFMNAEQVESSPYMSLGEISFLTSTIKTLEGLLTGSSDLDSFIYESQIYNPTVKDLVNESLHPLMDPPQITTGGGGSVTKYIEGLVSGSTQLALGNLTLTSLLFGDLNTGMELDSNIPGVAVVDFILNLRSSLESEKFVAEYSIANLDYLGSGSIDSTLSVFVSLPTFTPSGSQELDVNKIKLIIPIEFSPQGNMVLSAPFSVIRVMEPGGISGQLNLDGSFSDSVIKADLNLQTSLDALLELISAPGEGTASDKDINLNIAVNSLSRDAFNTEITTANTTYSGIRRSQRMYFESKLFDELTRRTLGNNNISQIYKETLNAMLYSFSDLVYVNDENSLVKIPCWHGSSERVVAKMKQEANIILPVLSIYKSNNSSDVDRRRSSSLIVYDTYWDKEKQRAVRIASISPTPVNISYKLNVWTKYQEDMDHITEQIHRKFNPDLEIKTKYNTTSKAFMIEESASSEPALPEGQDRVIRKTFTIEVESYIPNPKYLITNTGKIEEYNAEIHIPLK